MFETGVGKERPGPAREFLAKTVIGPSRDRANLSQARAQYFTVRSLKFILNSFLKTKFLKKNSLSSIITFPQADFQEPSLNFQQMRIILTHDLEQKVIIDK